MPRSNQSFAEALGAAGLRSMMLSEPLAGSPSKARRYCPDSACQRLAPSFTTTLSATAQMERPESGMAAGRWRRSSRTERVMRLAGTLAATSACAVRSTMRSWNEKRHALRGPRAGETKPASIRARMVLRGRRRSFSTSRTPYWCTRAVPLFLRGLLPRRFCRLGFLGRLGLARRLLLEASAQGFHQVDHLAAAGLGCLGKGDLLPLDLLPDRGVDPLSHFVLVRGRVELVGSLLLDQLLRELELGVLHLGLRDVDFLDRAHFGGIEELLHHQGGGAVLLDRPDHDDVLLAARRPAAERAAAGLAQRAREKRIRLGAALVGCEVIGLVEVDRIDRLDRHELGDVGRVGPGLLHRLQLLRREHHVLVLGELVALHHLLARDRDLLLHAEVLLLEPRAAGLVQQVEGNRLG